MSTRAPSPEPIRLVQVLTRFDFGGTEKQVLTLAGRFDPERFDVRFACMRRWGELLSELEMRGTPIDEYPIRSFFTANAIRQILRFAAALRRDRVQVVQSYNFYANLLAVPAARLARVPCVVASLRDTGVYMNDTQRRAHRMVCRMADRMVVNAGAIRDWLVADGYPADRISVIRNGLDLQCFPATNGSDPELYAELGLPADAQLVTLIARLDPQKGIEDFVEAAARIRGRFPRAHFVVVGSHHVPGGDDSIEVDRSYQAHIERRAASLGLCSRMVFTGFRPDVHRILAASTLSVLPSRSEGLPNSVLESMAAGVAVVATRVGGIPELIEHERHGLLVSPAAPGELAGAMAKLLGNPCFARQLGARARARVQQCFSFERMLADTEALYREILEQRK